MILCSFVFVQYRNGSRTEVQNNKLSTLSARREVNAHLNTTLSNVSDNFTEPTIHKQIPKHIPVNKRNTQLRYYKVQQKQA